MYFLSIKSGVAREASFAPKLTIPAINSNCVLQLVFIYLSKTYNTILYATVDKCLKIEPFLLNSLKLIFQSNDNARYRLILCSNYNHKR